MRRGHGGWRFPAPQRLTSVALVMQKLTQSLPSWRARSVGLGRKQWTASSAIPGARGEYDAAPCRL